MIWAYKASRVWVGNSLRKQPALVSGKQRLVLRIRKEDSPVGNDGGPRRPGPQVVPAGAEGAETE